MIQNNAELHAYCEGLKTDMNAALKAALLLQRAIAKLEAERDDLSRQRKEAEGADAGSMEVIRRQAFRIGDIEAKRDEAREWANCRTRTANKLYEELESKDNQLIVLWARAAAMDKTEDDLRAQLASQYDISRQEYKENSQLRGRLNKMKTTWLEALDLWQRLRITLEQERDKTEAENADLRAQFAAVEDENLDIRIQLGTARNDALDEAKDAAWIMLCQLGHKWHTRKAVTDAIRALKS